VTANRNRERQEWSVGRSLDNHSSAARMRSSFEGSQPSDVVHYSSPKTDLQLIDILFGVQSVLFG
jgi:hypothetical protein